jgi:hypothetical protein
MTISTAVILLKGRDELRINDALCDGAVSPGHLLKFTSLSKVKKHDVRGGWFEKLVALENSYLGKTPSDAYVDAERAFYAQLLPGNEVAFLVKSGQNVVVGEPLCSGGDGTLVSANSTPQFYVNTAESAEHENTTDEALFDKYTTIPAGYLKAGDVIHVTGQVTVADNNSTDTLTLTLRLGGLSGTAVIATAAVDVADNDVGYIDAYLVVRTVGSSGTFVASGVQGLGVPGTVTAKPFTKVSTAVDTTAALVIGISADWSVGHADNEASLTTLIVEVLRSAEPNGISVVAIPLEASGSLGADTLIHCRVI